MKLHTGDEVLVTAGKDKGRKGKIEKLFPGMRALVPGINVYKKHQRALAGRKGGIIEFSRALPFGNIVLVCPHCGKQTRVGIKVLKTGEKVRTCKKCGRQIDSNLKAQSSNVKS
ncbi:50S ribosomal protein L24 [Candidatus Microgenomates bacterium]|nr:50S ribosomal protein L24 [Candidatus Microgenomates bacterium]